MRRLGLYNPRNCSIQVSLSPGTRLGAYEVVALLGAGGMGEVYRARDTKLGREVALKILPELFAGDAERLARFSREAQVLASLNHPNIAAIYGIEDTDGVRALVLELVDGPTLADRLARGAIPLDEALPIARQIADALECAHEQGIVHRDLKPANIKVRDDGTVKVLDFGLAKFAEATVPAAVASLTQSPTITTPAMTAAGMILGTAAYMSPEQAKGRPADKRSDIWAFGCVVYEMLTGTRTFDGEDVGDTLAAILRSEPDWTRLRVPRPLEKLVQRSLVKDSRHRLQAIGDARLELEELAMRADSVRDELPVSPPVRRRVALWLGVAMLFGAGAGVTGWILRTPVHYQAIYRATLLTPGNFTAVQSGRLALSPDGKQIAFAALDAMGHQYIWLRRLDQSTAHIVPGSEAGVGPFWSPDSTQLAFVAAGKLKKVAVTGGAPLVLANAIPGVPGSWNSEDVILFSPASSGPIHRVSAAGGAATPVTRLDESGGETGHRLPVFLPDGRRFLYVATHFTRPAGVFLASLTDPTPRRVGDITSNVAYGSNALLFFRGETLVAQLFDPDTATFKRAPTVLADQVQVNLGGRVGSFTISQRGQLAYQAGSVFDRRLVIVDRAGHEDRVIAPRGNINDVQVSPEGRLAALSTSFDPSAQGRDIWLLDLRAQGQRRFTVGLNTSSPIWAPDASTILFSSDRDGHFDLYSKRVDPPVPEVRVFSDQADKYPLDWSKTGEILFARVAPEGGTTEICLLSPRPGAKPITLTEVPLLIATAKFSPDGRFVAYTAGTGSTTEVYVFTRSGTQKQQVSINGGSTPRWSRDGKELFFVSQQQLMTVAYEPNGSSMAPPKPLFKVRFAGGIRDPYDVMPDGQHFVLQDAFDQSEPITLLTNWPLLMQRHNLTPP